MAVMGHVDAPLGILISVQPLKMGRRQFSSIILLIHLL